MLAVGVILAVLGYAAVTGSTRRGRKVASRHLDRLEE